MSLFGKFGISLGLLNALSNFLLWMLTTTCAVVSERIYRRMSTYDCARNGYTRATDATEISIVSWVFPEQFRRRHTPAWWVFILLGLNILLVPLEILSESGIDEYRRCHPKTLESSGVCAAPWKSRSLHGAYAAAVLADRFDWVDKDWDVVLQGQPKKPDGQQVHTWAMLKNKDHVYLVKDCKISYGRCPSIQSCGELTFGAGIHELMVYNWSNINAKRSFRFGSLASDAPLYLASLFWGQGATAIPDNKKKFPGRKRIAVSGIEMILNAGEKAKLEPLKEGFKLRHHRSNAHVKLPVIPTRARTYVISCITDGIPANDLAMAVSIYRTATLEAPSDSDNREHLKPSLTTIPPLNTSDVAKAVYAFKTADADGKCEGMVEMYTVCGYFRVQYLLPFFTLVAVIILGWVVVVLWLPKADARVPVDASAWRHQAQRVMRQEEGRVKKVMSNTNLKKMHSGMYLMGAYSTDGPVDVDLDETTAVEPSSTSDFSSFNRQRRTSLPTMDRGFSDEHTVDSTQLHRLEALPDLESEDDVRFLRMDSLK